MEITTETKEVQVEVLPLAPPEQTQDAVVQTQAPTTNSSIDNEVLAAVLDDGIRGLLNVTLTTKNQISTEEMKSTNLGKALVAVMNKYFPDAGNDSPAIMLVFSAASLGLLINAKGGFKFEQGNKPSREIITAEVRPVDDNRKPAPEFTSPTLVEATVDVVGAPQPSTSTSGIN